MRVPLQKVLHAETRAAIHWGASTTRPTVVSRGLHQGCPMSPIAFMFTSVLERHLVESGIGFDFTYVKEGTTCTRRLRALLYIDDIVLLADSVKNLQRLLDVCSSEGDPLVSSSTPRHLQQSGYKRRHPRRVDKQTCPCSCRTTVSFGCRPTDIWAWKSQWTVILSRVFRKEPERRPLDTRHSRALWAFAALHNSFGKRWRCLA